MKDWKCVAIFISFMSKYVGFYNIIAYCGIFNYTGKVAHDAILKSVPLIMCTNNLFGKIYSYLKGNCTN